MVTRALGRLALSSLMAPASSMLLISCRTAGSPHAPLTHRYSDMLPKIVGVLSFVTIPGARPGATLSTPAITGEAESHPKPAPGTLINSTPKRARSRS